MKCFRCPDMGEPRLFGCGFLCFLAVAFWRLNLWGLFDIIRRSAWRKTYEKINLQRNLNRGKYAVRHVFRGRESDLSSFHGADGRKPDLGGVRRLPDHRRGASASWRGGLGNQPGKRTFGFEQPRRKRLRLVFHQRAVFDHRTVFRDPQMRDGFLYGWN